MPTLKQRIFTTFMVTMGAGLLGILAGFFVARAVTARVMQSQLDQYAGQLIADEEAAATELRTALAAIDASEYRSCSQAEVGYLRALIFESQSLKDAGRVAGGSIRCSAALGKPANVPSLGQPEFQQQDGTAIYRDLKPYESSGMSTLTIERGGSFVVYTPLTRLHLESAPLHFVETATDAPTQRHGRLLGEALNVTPELLTTEGFAERGNLLVSTRCSIRFFDCVSAYVTLPEAIEANQMRFHECVLLVGVLCAVLGCSMSLLYRRNKSMEQQLRRAIRQGKIRVFYQPIVDLSSRRTVGAEALARWTDEEGHFVPPDVFIRIAEQRGFVGEITRLVVGQVLRDFALTMRQQPDFRVSVNVTAADLEDESFPLMLESLLTREAVPARNLTIEITESSTVRQQVAMDAIRKLRACGHAVHIDDFGTGYSSLSYLQDLAVDAIKIDKSFTRAIGTGSVTVGILPQILSIVETLNLSVIVEGVETSEQASYFASTNYPVLAQGWLFGKAVPLAEFVKQQAELTTQSVALIKQPIESIKIQPLAERPSNANTKYVAVLPEAQ